MELNRYADEIREQLAIAAQAGGDDARALAERLAAPLDSVVRLVLLEALGVAAAEITRELAPGSVDVRLRGRDPEFVVTPAPPGPDAEPAAATTAVPDLPAPDDAAVSRINLRLPDTLKARIEQAAERDGLSINAWLTRAAASAVDRGEAPPPAERTVRSGQHYRGWAR